MNFLSPDSLFSLPTGAPPAYFAIVPVAFGLIFIAGLVAYWRRAKLAPENPVLRRFIRRASKAAMWTSGLGLFFCVMRYVQFDYLDEAIWFYLVVLAMVVIAGYFVYDRSENYPLAVWKLQESHVQRRYRPVARQRVEPQRQRSTNVRGKRKR